MSSQGSNLVIGSVHGVLMMMTCPPTWVPSLSVHWRDVWGVLADQEMKKPAMLISAMNGKTSCRLICTRRAALSQQQGLVNAQNSVRR